MTTTFWRKGWRLSCFNRCPLLHLEAMLGASEPKAVGSAVIVDPVEGIRIDLVRYYTAKFDQTPDGKAKQQQVSEVLSKRKVLDVKR